VIAVVGVVVFVVAVHLYVFAALLLFALHLVVELCIGEPVNPYQFQHAFWLFLPLRLDKILRKGKPY
jgi:hypothetical protein